jgi:DNA replication protein DnaC
VGIPCGFRRWRNDAVVSPATTGRDSALCGSKRAASGSDAHADDAIVPARAQKTLVQFDWKRAHGLERARVEQVGRCAEPHRAQRRPVGPVGTGNTHLATALGIEAIKRSLSITPPTWSER